jgi:hypothetical protein
MDAIGDVALISPDGGQVSKISTALPSDVLALYAENGSMARAMMDWRHRVVTLYVLTIGAIGSGSFWLYDHRSLHLLPLLLLAGAVITGFLALMDNTNANILRACYRVGSDIEQRAVGFEGGIYAALYRRSLSRRTFTYSRVLRVLFVGTSILLLMVAVFFSWEPFVVR